MIQNAKKCPTESRLHPKPAKSSPHLCKINLPSTPLCSECSLLFRFSNQNIVFISHLFHACYMSCLSIACFLISLFHYYSVTPWCRTLFDKLIVTQLVKEYPAFLWNSKVHYRVHKSPPLNPFLSQLNSVCPIDPYLPKVHLNVILPPAPSILIIFGEE
jgi:hypothetical protein